MTFGDYSPPSSPSLAQQRDALQRGLGRALQWALGGRLGEGPLLEACLRDQRYDHQVERSRGDWLWQMIQALGAAERFRVPVLHALYDLSDGRSANQLCELARHYAEAGDETFRARLYEIVEQKPVADCPWLGEDEIVALDGEPAFLVAARVRGRLLATREWDWDDGSLIDLATERLGEERVGGLLESATDESIRRLRESWRQDQQRKAERKNQPSHMERMAAIAPQDILEEAAGNAKRYWFRGWGMHADEGALKAVLERLFAEEEPQIIANLASVFWARPLPEFDARLIELCRHDDEEVRRWAFTALEANAHPLVREFALTELEKGVQDRSVVGLFINNYRQGDEHRILEAMVLPEDLDDRHGLLLDATKMLEKNPTADCSRLALVAYFSTPCDHCRLYAARLLLDHDAAPAWMIDECRYDANEDCRKLVESTDGAELPRQAS